MGVRLKGFTLQPETKEEALANIRKTRADLGLGGQTDRNELRKLLKQVGSLGDEIVESKRRERKL
jgi:hypothetical protein